MLPKAEVHTSSRTVRYVAPVLLALALTACDSSKPNPVGPTQPSTVRPSLTVTSVSVVGEKRVTGYAYTVVLQLRESAGVPATITSVDLTFTATTTAVSSHHDQPISPTTNVCPASGTVGTRQLVTVDADAFHSYATTVIAKVTFSDGGAFASMVEASAQVPPLSPPVPTVYTLTGVITDTSTHRAIPGARLEVLTGPNAGTSATADQSGTYVLSDLVAGSFRLRASADNYTSGEQGVTVPDNPRADFELRHIAYTLTGVITDSNTHVGIVGARVEAINGPNAGKSMTTDATGAYVMAELVAGTSRMRASAAGYESGEQNVTVPDNPRADFELRSGTCAYSVTLNGPRTLQQSPGDSTLTVTRTAGTCGWHAITNVTWMTLDATSGTGSGSVPFRWSANSIAPRSGTITVEWSSGSVGFMFTQLGGGEDICFVNIDVNGQSILNAPAAGASYTATVTIIGSLYARCGQWTVYDSSPGITSVQAYAQSVSFVITANPLHVSRTLQLTVALPYDSYPFGHGTSYSTLTLSQSGSP